MTNVSPENTEQGYVHLGGHEKALEDVREALRVQAERLEELGFAVWCGDVHDIADELQAALDRRS